MITKNKSKSGYTSMNEEIGFTIDIKLIITGQKLVPNKITELLKLKPTKTHLMGDKRTPSSTLLHKKHGWIYSIKGDSYLDSIDKPLESFLKLLMEHKNELKNITRIQDVKIYCVIVGKSYTPGIILSTAVIQSLALLDIPIEFDIQ